MKKIISVILICVFLCTALFGCANTADSGTGKDDFKIGIAAPSVTHGWVAGVAYYAEKYCKDQGITYKITTSADAAEMMANLNDLVAWGADAIVLWPQWTGMESAVAEIVEQNIPVVSFDVDVACPGIYKVTGNNYGMGYESAKYITEKVGEAATIAVLDIPSAGSIAELRKQGFYDYLNEIGYDTSNIFEISQIGFTRDEGLRSMTDILESHKHIDAVFSMDDETSIGVIQAIIEAGRTDIHAITGGGGMQEYFRMMKEEKYASLGLASALYSPAMVEDAVKAAISLCRGEACDSCIVIPTTIVTAANADEYIDANNTVY